MEDQENEVIETSPGRWGYHTADGHACGVGYPSKGAAIAALLRVMGLVPIRRGSKQPKE